MPFVGPLRRDDGEGRIWGAIIDRVLRRPGCLDRALRWAAPRSRGTGTSAPHRGTRARDLPAEPAVSRPTTVSRSPSRAPDPGQRRRQGRGRPIAGAQSAIAELKRRRWRASAAEQADHRRRQRAGTVANISVPVDGTGTDSASNAALAALRDEIVPATVGTIPGAEVGVSGFTAESKDFNDKMKSVAPLVFGFVLVFAFVLLLFAFRSLVLAAKAIVLNLLSVAAAYGILVLVFQHGWGKELLGFDSTAGIDSVPADLPLRDPVRALDGLPRVHPEPDPRGLRPRHEHRARRSLMGSRRRPASSRARRSSWSASSRSSRRSRC